jgi:hypothetical protein
MAGPDAGLVNPDVPVFVFFFFFFNWRKINSKKDIRKLVWKVNVALSAVFHANLAFFYLNLFKFYIDFFELALFFLLW